MADKIRVNYPALEDMAKHCQMVAQQLQQTAALANKIAAQMQNGALVGRPGDTFVQALGQLQQRTMKLSGKFVEVSNDIKQAVSDMQAADSAAGQKF
jgi:WXG100 family type VII secretion target